MGDRGLDFTISIGGAAGQGIATPGNILARIVARRGLHLYAYNAFQSIIRGGHIFLTLRTRDEEVRTHGDGIDLLLCLNQDTMDRHVGLLRPGSRVLYDGDKIRPGEAQDDVLFCPMPVAELTEGSKNRLIQNTVSLGVMMSLMGVDFSVLEETLELLERISSSSDRFRSRSALVRAAIREFAEAERRRLEEAREREIIRVNREQLARQAKALVEAQAEP